MTPHQALHQQAADAIREAIRDRYATQDWARTEGEAAADAVVGVVLTMAASEDTRERALALLGEQSEYREAYLKDASFYHGVNVGIRAALAALEALREDQDA